MNYSNPDLEANLLPNNRPYNNPERPAQPTQTSALTLRNEIMSDVIKMWEFSPMANIALLLVHLSKLGASLYVILYHPFPCIAIKQIWIFAMLAFDIVYILIIFARLHHTKKVKYSDSRRNQVHDENPDNRQGQLEANNNPLLPPGENYQISSSFARETSKLYRNHVIIWFLTRTFQFIWFLLFMWGQYLIIFSTESSCDTPSGDTLIAVFVIMGYVWILLPLVLVALLYIILITWFALRIRQVRPASTVQIDRLPVQKYSHSLQGDIECAVCMLDYQLEEKIVQLRCNTKHFFHEECIKKWLKINGICPICRVKVENP